MVFRKKDINELFFKLIILLFFLGNISFRNYLPVLYFTKALFIGGFVLRLFTTKVVVINSFVVRYVCLVTVASLGLTYCQNYSAFVDAFDKIVQNGLLSLLLYTYIDSEEKFKFVLKCFVFSGALLILYLLSNMSGADINIMLNSQNEQDAELRFGYITGGAHPNTIAIEISLYMIGLFALKDSSKNKLFKLIGWLLLAISMFFLILTKSRKSLLGFVLGYIIYYIYSKGKSKKITSLFRYVVPVIVVMVAYWALFNVSFIYNIVGFRFEGLFNFFSGASGVDASTRDRMQFIINGIDMFLKHPVLGVSMGNFAYYNFTYYHSDLLYSHCNYVEVLSGMGILGFISYYGIFPNLFLKSFNKMKNFAGDIRKYYAALFAMFCVLLFTDLSAITYTILDVWLLVAMVYAFVFNIKLKDG